MDFHREHRRRADLLGGLGEWAVPSSEPGTGPHSPEEALLRRELSSWVRHAIHDLPVGLRQPVVLRFFREMPHRDIAVELKLSSDNVRKRLQYARDILGRRLGRLATAQAAVPTPRAIPPRVRAAPRGAPSLTE